MSDTPEQNKHDSDCTPPPDHPLPADQLGRYSPERDFYAEKEIAVYVEGQAHGEETVQNVERVKTEYVMGAPYEIWDVSTDKERWWVITNPTEPRLYTLVSCRADDARDEPIQRRRRRGIPV
jgi:hypothetical protein